MAGTVESAACESADDGEEWSCGWNSEFSDFHIGLEFWTETGQWRCTDVGTRTICALKVDSVGADWLNGPPYAVVESVFDEYDFGALMRPGKTFRCKRPVTVSLRSPRRRAAQSTCR